MTAIHCGRCHGRHQMGAFTPGDRVVAGAVGKRDDGIQPGTRGTVVAYVIAAGARHQDVKVRLRGSAKRVVVFAPCELLPAPVEAPGRPAGPAYESLTRQEFVARLRERRVSLRLVTDLDAVASLGQARAGRRA